MKAVTMMRKAIKDASKNTYYKWKATKDGVIWSYLDSVFTLKIEKETSATIIRFEDEQTGIDAYVCLVGEEDARLCDKYHDFVVDIDEGIYWACYRIIEKAEYLY